VADKQPINPYEVTPRIYDRWWELLREKAQCERAKNLALEIGRLGLVLAFWMFCVAVGYGLKTNDIVGLIYRLLGSAALAGVGLGIAYPWYLPNRKRLNEIQQLLPLPEEQAADDPDEAEEDLD
jgi:hypothetical protein